MICCYDLDGGSAPTCRQRRDAKQADLHRACPLVKYTGAGCYPEAAPWRTVTVRALDVATATRLLEEEN